MQYNLTGELLHEYKSLAIAQEKTGVDKANIMNCCSGHRRQTGGFIWRYRGDRNCGGLLVNRIRQIDSSYCQKCGGKLEESFVICGECLKVEL